jgi:hypothetical protein
LLIFIVVGGGFATLSVPKQWSILVNPANTPSVQEPSGLALYYNQTLSALGTGHYSEVSLLLGTIRFVDFASSLNQTVQTGNTQIASTNVTMPKATSDLHKGADLVAQRQFLAAGTYVTRGCGLADQANATLSAFKDSTVPKLTSSGVSAGLYSIGLGLASRAVSSLLADCTELQSSLSLTGPSSLPPSLLSISSSQKSVETGGSIVINGSLTLNGVGLPNQSIFLYFNGTFVGEVPSTYSGRFGGKVSIPFVYQPVGVVQAFVATNATAGFGAATSNSVELLVLFNGTRIVLGDPPAYLPTSRFQVHGELTTADGVPLPSAPVIVTFFSEAQDATTDSSGTFVATLYVPASTPDGTYNVTAVFAPRGTLGPSFNFTSIEVAHEPLNVTVNVSSLTLAGFSTSLQGRVVANGTGVSGAKVTVSSPWGSFQATTDSTGRYALSVPTPILDFSFSEPLQVGADPAQPYIASGQSVASLSLFNLLIVVIPAIALLGLGFGARTLGLLGGEGKFEEVTTSASENQTMALELEVEERDLPEMLALYRRILTLATARFQISFGRNMTLREIAAEISAVSDKRGASLSAHIIQSTEAFLYAERFDLARLKEAKEDISELEELWKK